ncbi:hypothetical protein ACFX13_043319 [Malus domestica]
MVATFPTRMTKGFFSMALILLTFMPVFSQAVQVCITLVSASPQRLYKGITYGNIETVFPVILLLSFLLLS